MNYEQIIAQLVRIYNTLMLVETKGESTLTFADCLRALQTLVTTLQKKEGEEEC